MGNVTASPSPTPGMGSRILIKRPRRDTSTSCYFCWSSKAAMVNKWWKAIGQLIGGEEGGVRCGRSIE